jgi:hypothetical protein
MTSASHTHNPIITSNIEKVFCEDIARSLSHRSTYGSTALYWALATFFSLLIYPQSIGLLGRVISPSQGRYLDTEQHKHRINAHRDIHAWSEIQTYDPSVGAGAATVIGFVTWMAYRCFREDTTDVI